MTKSAYFATGDRVYSYQTVIRQTLPGGLTIGNVTHYSVTTSAHQRKAGSASCDVLLGDVPRGTSDLLQLAIDRGMIEPSEYHNWRLSARSDIFAAHPAMNT